MKKKAIILLLVLSLVVCGSLTACRPKDNKEVFTSSNKEEKKNNKLDKKDKNKSIQTKQSIAKITIASTKELTGDWIKSRTNSACDYEVYKFITGMNTIAITPDGRFEINKTVVENINVRENKDRSKTYTFTIRDGLKYADNSEIDSKDYVTSIMIWSLKLVQDSGAQSGIGKYLKGYMDFSRGNKKEFAGINLINKKEFSLTIAAEHLPYFYELAAVEAWPTKLSFWTDDSIDIKDDGDGVYFSKDFNLESFQKTFDTARKEVEKFPSTGPYKLVSYDKIKKVVDLQVNENFPGDYRGQKPKIEKIIYKYIKAEKAIEELEAGTIDMVSKVTDADNIDKALKLVNKGGFNYVEYARSGYGKLVFQTDFGPTKDVEVRKALAHLINREDSVKEFTDEFGLLVDGPYMEDMWFYQETKSKLDDKLNKYTYNIELAKELLENAGWIFDKEGNEYRQGIRYKKQEDGKLIPLKIELASTEKNIVSDILLVKLQENPDIKEVGMEIKQSIMTFDELLLYMYRDGTNNKKYKSPKFGMYNLATDFTAKYDLSTNYTTDPKEIKSGYNINFLVDEKLEKAAKSMVSLNPEDEERYKENFIEFVTRWNELLPDIPLYSNLYYDFFNDKLKNYKTNSFTNLSDSLLYSYIKEK